MGRSVTERSGAQLAFVMAAAAAVTQGHLAALIAGELAAARPGEGADAGAQAADAAGIVVVGIAEKTTTASEAGGARVPVKAGTFLFDNDQANPATLSDVGSSAYVVDDHTVSSSHAVNTRPKAGTIIDVEGAGVWVRVGV